MDCDDLKAGPSPNRLDDGYGAVRTHRRGMWIVCAIASFLSSRYLLVELNVNFPLHLHLLQLATAAIVTAILHFRRRPDTSSPLPNRASVAGWVVLVVLAVLSAASLILTFQAVLHFQNLPTLVMLATLSCCIEAWTLLCTCHGSRSRLGFARIAALAMGCAGILLGEYRLLVANLITAIPAVLMTGLARGIRRIIVNRMPGTATDSRRTRMLLCGIGLAMTAICAARRDDETWERFTFALELRYVPMLLINLVATAGAMLLGQSVLIPMDDIEGDSSAPANEGSLGDMLTLLSTAGAIGLASTLMLRRSYMSWAQLVSFLLAAGCIGGKSAVDSLRNRSSHYDMVPSALESFSMDSEDGLSDSSDTTRVAGASGHRTSLLRRFFLLAVLVPSAWLAYSALNFSERIYHTTVREEPILDMAYTPEAASELVISMYKEPVEEVAHLVSTLKAMPNLRDSHVRIYVKDSDANVDSVKQGTGADEVTSLPNIGREGETFLHHILNRWDGLAKHTVFLQADVHNPREFYPRIRDYFDPERTGMLSLGWSGQVCNCENCGDRYNLWDTMHLFPSMHARINNATACDKVLLSFKGQFIASAKRIRGVDRSVYQDLQDAFVNEDSWAHQEEFLKGRPDSMSAPAFGYTMERMWNLLFQCDSMDVAWKCPTLLSGNRIGGSIEDCQCFDPA